MQPEPSFVLSAISMLARYARTYKNLRLSFRIGSRTTNYAIRARSRILSTRWLISSPTFVCKHTIGVASDGKRIEFRDARPMRYTMYKNNRLHGFCVSLWKNGDIFAKITCRYGVRHGLSIFYSSRDVVSRYEHYVRGELHGDTVTYRYDRGVKIVTKFVDGRCFSRCKYTLDDSLLKIYYQ